ncbi:hypothetical protein [Aminobacter sp. AP02]|uniref:hypothetical protein n=1 Tax=Aminobacter sp. AP02 TaxID=2135737 RepID=UPI0011B29A39|nr:hypothetical protein [Aminobacter sp. AP02]
MMRQSHSVPMGRSVAGRLRLNPSRSGSKLRPFDSRIDRFCDRVDPLLVDDSMVGWSDICLNLADQFGELGGDRAPTTDEIAGDNAIFPRRTLEMTLSQENWLKAFARRLQSNASVHR